MKYKNEAQNRNPLPMQTIIPIICYMQIILKLLFRGNGKQNSQQNDMHVSGLDCQIFKEHCLIILHHRNHKRNRNPTFAVVTWYPKAKSWNIFYE